VYVLRVHTCCRRWPDAADVRTRSIRRAAQALQTPPASLDTPTPTPSPRCARPTRTQLRAFLQPLESRGTITDAHHAHTRGVCARHALTHIRPGHPGRPGRGQIPSAEHRAGSPVGRAPGRLTRPAHRAGLPGRLRAGGRRSRLVPRQRASPVQAGAGPGQSGRVPVWRRTERSCISWSACARYYIILCYVIMYYIILYHVIHQQDGAVLHLLECLRIIISYNII
jgi:hypothetical protein